MALSRAATHSVAHSVALMVVEKSLSTWGYCINKWLPNQAIVDVHGIIHPYMHTNEHYVKLALNENRDCILEKCLGELRFSFNRSI
jgi:hypothetical protein